MDELLHLSFAELEALRQYYISTLSGDNSRRMPGSKDITLQYIQTIGETIEKKFEDLITVKTNGGTATASRPQGKKPLLG